MTRVLARLVVLLVLFSGASPILSFISIFANLLPLLDGLLLAVSVLIAIYSSIKRKMGTDVLIMLLVTIFVYSCRNAEINLRPTDDKEITLLSLNVAQFNNDTANVSEVIQLINKEVPDVVLVQEFGLYYKWPDISTVSRDFAQRIGFEYYHFQPHDGNIFGTAIFSKRPILGSTLVFNEISQTNEAWSHLIKLKEDTVQLINAHVESFNLKGPGTKLGLKDVLKRQENQATIIQSAISDKYKSMICVDLNAAVGSKIYNQFRKSHIDVSKTQGLGWVNTLKWPPIRIDHVFADQNIQCTELELLENTPSDHRGIIASFR